MPGDDDARGHAERAIDTAHQLALVPGQIVVDSDHVNASAGNGVQVRGEGGHQGLALTGLHLSDIAEVECATTHNLHVEVTQPDGALGCLANRGKGLRKHVVERFARGKTLAEVCCLLAQLVIGKRRESCFERVYGTRHTLQLAKDAPFAHAQDKIKNGCHRKLRMLTNFNRVRETDSRPTRRSLCYRFGLALLGLEFPGPAWPCDRLPCSIHVGHRARWTGGHPLNHLCRGRLDVHLAKSVCTRLVNRQRPMVASAVHLVLVLVLAHLVDQVSEREIESAVLVFAVGFGSVGVSGAHQSEFHSVATDQPFTRMMTADGDV